MNFSWRQLKVVVEARSRLLFVLAQMVEMGMFNSSIQKCPRRPQCQLQQTSHLEEIRREVKGVRGNTGGQSHQERGALSHPVDKLLMMTVLQANLFVLPFSSYH